MPALPDGTFLMARNAVLFDFAPGDELPVARVDLASRGVGASMAAPSCTTGLWAFVPCWGLVEYRTRSKRQDLGRNDRTA